MFDEGYKQKEIADYFGVNRQTILRKQNEFGIYPRNLVGKQFGRLTVVSKNPQYYIRSNNSKESMWNCICSCGKTTVVSSNSLNSGNVKSCGCLRRETTSRLNLKHGKYNHPLYKIWLGMKNRCSNTNGQYAHRYVLRGIRVCKDWRDNFESFYDWAINNGYKKGLQIDRIDNYGNYEPENCRWVTCSENCSNRNNNILIKVDGIEHTQEEWKSILNVNRTTIVRHRQKNDICEYIHDKLEELNER